MTVTATCINATTPSLTPSVLPRTRTLNISALARMTRIPSNHPRLYPTFPALTHEKRPLQHPTPVLPRLPLASCSYPLHVPQRTLLSLPLQSMRTRLSSLRRCMSERPRPELLKASVLSLFPHPRQACFPHLPACMTFRM